MAKDIYPRKILFYYNGGINKMEKIKLYYIVLNNGLNLATADKARATMRINEILGFMQMERNKHWKIEISYS